MGTISSRCSLRDCRVAEAAPIANEDVWWRGGRPDLPLTRPSFLSQETDECESRGGGGSQMNNNPAFKHKNVVTNPIDRNNLDPYSAFLPEYKF